MSLLDGCLNDELSSPSTIGDFDYFITATGLHTIPTPTFTQTLSGCPIEWSITGIDGTGSEIDLTD